MTVERQRSLGGIGVCCGGGASRAELLEWMAGFRLADGVEVRSDSDGSVLALELRPDLADAWTPGWNTLSLRDALGAAMPGGSDDLSREILVAMLASPVRFAFPSLDELAAAVRVRCNIVDAARRTALDFATGSAERPADCWTYAEETGFTVRPGFPLVEALRKATQPTDEGPRYSFSCYRATEYVILLALAEELQQGNPDLLASLQRQWETRAIASARFHDVFLREYGSLEAPLPPRYYVPGDRLWFRNPDEHSADVTGFEGSWVFYLGGGLFSNFWCRKRPWTLEEKCLELFHWRHGTYRDADGELRMDERVVEERVRQSRRQPDEVAAILEAMMRMREPRGHYGRGGCIDASREYPRWVCPGTSDLALPMQ